MNTENCDDLSSAGSVFCTPFNTRAETGLNRSSAPTQRISVPSCSCSDNQELCPLKCVSEPAPTQAAMPRGEDMRGKWTVGGLVGPQEMGQARRLFAQRREPGKGLPGIGEVDVGWKHGAFLQCYVLQLELSCRNQEERLPTQSCSIMYILLGGQAFYSHYAFLLQLSGCNIHLLFYFCQYSWGFLRLLSLSCLLLFLPSLPFFALLGTQGIWMFSQICLICHDFLQICKERLSLQNKNYY